MTAADVAHVQQHGTVARRERDCGGRGPTLAGIGNRENVGAAEGGGAIEYYQARILHRSSSI